MHVAVSPILWHNEDLPDLMPPIDADTLVEEILAAGFNATEYSSLFPEDAEGVAALLARRGLRLVSAFVALRLPGVSPVAESARALERARFVRDSGGDTLVVALDYDEQRKRCAGSVGPDDPKLDEAGWHAVTEALHEIGRGCADLGIALVFHNEAGTFVETPGEFGEVARRTDPALVGLCLDVGHLTVGGGDAIAFYREHRERVRHVHVKDASSEVIEGLRCRRFDMMEALRRRVFCELGSGVLDVEGLVGELKAAGYDRWVVLEQDSTSRRPLDAAKQNRETFRRLAGI